MRIQPCIERFLKHPRCNITPRVADKIGRNLYLKENHPLCILKNAIQKHFQPHRFETFDHLSPIVTVKQSFDDLLIPKDHVSRRPSDTYYCDDVYVLRPQTSAHQIELLKDGKEKFLVCGDVYRRDEIDSTHYPVFHQMEGVSIHHKDEIPDSVEGRRMIEDDLKSILVELTRTLFGNVEMRWVEAYFPFTTPSFELEIIYQGNWMEVLGCGLVHSGVLKNANQPEKHGWAFGLGMERLAMLLFDIPDIRLFWSEDSRFLDQFEKGKIVKMEPFSKYPPCTKDISFWVGDEFHVNDLYEMVRETAGDLVEKVTLIDNFTNPETGRTSHCYRIVYRSMERSLTNEEVDGFQEVVRTKASARGLELR